jgi:hypothetical protein
MNATTNFIDIKPTWADAAEIMIAVLRDSDTANGRESAAKEIRNMARAADAAKEMHTLLTEIEGYMRLDESSNAGGYVLRARHAVREFLNRAKA